LVHFICDRAMGFSLAWSHMEVGFWVGWMKEPALHKHELPGGWTVFAGKTDADNDFLSLKLAKPNDRWFHVRGMPGSHVILSGPEGEQASKEVLKTAAAIAAYYSKARRGGEVAVSCTEARFVTKPHRAKPGSVQIRKEIIFKVRPGLPSSEA